MCKLLCRTVRFESVASRIMPPFITASVFDCQSIAIMVVTASMIMRSALSAIPIVSIFIPSASALARV